MEPKILTHYEYPPIPIRKFDWCATYDDSDGRQVGWGETEEQAIADLRDNYVDLYRTFAEEPQ